MKELLRHWLFLFLCSVSVSAATRYVDLNCATPVSPYASWSTAATNIQDVVDVAAAGDVVLVAAGVYQVGGRVVYGALTNRVVIDRPVTVQSVSGPGATVIQGNPVSGSNAVRCVYLTNNAVLAGFTLANGANWPGDITLEGAGGGAWCESTNAVVSNCVFTANVSIGNGGGAYGGTLINCELKNNTSQFGYGGAAAYCTLYNCTVSSNFVNNGYHGGGVAYSTLNNCVVRSNLSKSNGGGAAYSTLNNCTLNGNSAVWGAGAVACTLNNCLVTGNAAANPSGSSYAAAVGGGLFSGVANNCTIVSNSVRLPIAPHAEAEGGGSYATTLNNCIIYWNWGPSGQLNAELGALANCCTIPLPAGGQGNFSAAPLFIGGTSRLYSNSPCINSGNNSLAPPGLDLAGNARVAGATVDVGAYEFQSPASVISYAWLQQFGLPTDGSADLSDPDGDRRNTWQEWRCDTNPTNAASVLRLLAPTSAPSGIKVTWLSSSARNYLLERASSLTAPPAFEILASNIPGQAGTTSYTDTNVASPGPFFYRVAPQ
jgi:hypothetical protein